MATKEEKIDEFTNALFLTFDSIALAKKALLASPSKEDERSLIRLIGALEVEVADIETRLNDVLDDDTSVKGPTPAQISEVGKLSAKVQQMTNQALQAKAVVTLVTNVLALASKIS